MGYKNGGLINGIFSGLQGACNIIYGIAFVLFVVAIVLWHEKLKIAIELILDLLTTSKKR